MAQLDTCKAKASILIKGDIIIDGSQELLIESVETKNYATKYVFHTVTDRRIFGIKIGVTRKDIIACHDAPLTVWHNMLIDGRNVMKGDKVYNKGTLSTVNKISRTSPNNFAFSTTTGKVKSKGNGFIFIAV